MGLVKHCRFLVDPMLQNKETLFLMQQPEVHLHPRAQAQIGSYLGKMIKEFKHQFVVETHSDYLIDRVRMDVRDGMYLRPKDVTILYFQKTGAASKIYRLGLDKNGNIIDPPPGYRDFFLREEGRFFGESRCV